MALSSHYRIAKGFSVMKLLPFALCALLAATPGCSTSPTVHKGATARPLPLGEYWLDLVSGEEVDESDVLDDLAGAGVIYVGEMHTIPRHHAIQLALLQGMFARGVPLVLCMEQLEARDQLTVDRYNRRELDFAGLAREMKWADKWRNYADYQLLCDFAQQHGIPIRALNAPADIVRAVSRAGGVAKLTAEQRAQLPADLMIEDSVYERLINLQMAVHVAAEAAKLRPMFEAQMTRDEVMGTNIVAARKLDGGKRRTAFVVLGAGHIHYGLGTAASVRRREPDIVERLILMTESGQLQMTSAEKAGSRETHITHADLRPIGRPPADYLRVLPKSNTVLPSGHPPITR